MQIFPYTNPLREENILISNMTAIVKHLRNHKPPQKKKKKTVIISEHQKNGNLFYPYCSRGLFFYFLVLFVARNLMGLTYKQDVFSSHKNSTLTDQNIDSKSWVALIHQSLQGTLW